MSLCEVLEAMAESVSAKVMFHLVSISLKSISKIPKYRKSIISYSLNQYHSSSDFFWG